ncbi:hypothetical protein [endosymbiont 'TC1' of Trimyema compressum]|nr:hypothetical protein [endosymbiont 'TC1' of Trimyema compressum]
MMDKSYKDKEIRFNIPQNNKKQLTSTKVLHLKNYLRLAKAYLNIF